MAPTPGARRHCRTPGVATSSSNQRRVAASDGARLLPSRPIAGPGLAASLALREHPARTAYCEQIKRDALAALTPVGIVLNGASDRTMPHTLNLSISGIDSEAPLVALKDIIAISNGSACTSQSYEPSHVLTSMHLTDEQVAGALRLSWSHLTPEVDWHAVVHRLSALI